MTYIKTGDVAAQLGVSEQAVRLWCRTGTLPARRPRGTRQWLIDEDEFRDWLTSGAVTDTVESLNAPYRESRSDEEIAAEFHEARERWDEAPARVGDPRPEHRRAAG